MQLEPSHNEIGDADDPDIVVPSDANRLRALMGFSELGPIDTMGLERQMAQKLHGANSAENSHAHDLWGVRVFWTYSGQADILSRKSAIVTDAMDGRLAQYLTQGEGIGLEFKRCGNQPRADVFETVCSFANRRGGSLLLGVLDDGSVEGIPEQSALPIERNLVSVTCNPKLFNVAPAIECERIPCGDGRMVIRVWVPMGPSVYAYKGVVYDRRGDADVKLTGEADRAAMAVRKQSYCTERKVYPWVEEADLDLSLLGMMRDEVRANDAGHRWLALGAEGSAGWASRPSGGEAHAPGMKSALPT